MIVTLNRFLRSGLLSLALMWASSVAQAGVPHLLNHQGRIAVGGVNFDGAGLFKFALVNPTGSTTYWSNDGTSVAGSEPSAAVTLTVSRGLYAVLLGDISMAHMSAVPAGIFGNEDVRLRVWFNDNVHGFQWITPDQRLAAAPYALAAESASSAHAIISEPLKPVIAWGSNSAGQTTVPALSGVTGIAAGEFHCLALLESGTVTAWGLNTSGQTTVPNGLSGVTEIAAGAAHNLVRRNDGTVIAWGGNSDGQTDIPAGLVTVVKVAAGAHHSLALRQDGTVAAWGDNTFGQTAFPPGLTGVTAIAAGYDHNLAMLGDGTVVAWGRNETGQIQAPLGLGPVKAIAAGAYHSLALKADGTVVAWGWNNAGQSSVPANLNGVVGIAGGYTFSMALKQDGSVVVWGDTSAAQGTIPSSATQVARIAAGASHALALRADRVQVPLARLDEDNVFTGRVGIKRTPAANALEVEGIASKSTPGNWAANSDRRIKTDIEPITGALETLSRVRLVDYKYTGEYRASHPGVEDRRYPNVVAQEFAEIFPDNVKSSGETMPDGTPLLQVDTYPLTIYTAAGLQELQRHHAGLKQENAQLREQLKDQEERLRRLEAFLPKQP